MIINAGFLDEWKNKGHCYGECMSHPDSDLMYVYIPKNASSWTKPNLLDFRWQFYNYHADNLRKHAIVALRDPVERWLSGIAEYFTLYHSTFPPCDWTRNTFDLVFDRVCFDDHTERQVKFLQGLDTDNCTFLWCDEHYRENFSKLLCNHGMPNRYHSYDYQHVSENSPERRQFKEIFANTIQNSKYLDKIRDYYAEDYALINLVNFYGST